MSIRRVGKRILSGWVAATILVSLLPSMVPYAKADGETFTFYDGAIYLDESYSGDTVYILGDVDLDQDGVIDDDGDIFSVTVNGATNVTIIFNNVTIDRRAATDEMNGQTVNGLYDVSYNLNWGTIAQTCPFLITGSSSVNAYFHGECTFYAGTNDSVVGTDDTYTAGGSGCGFAAIQVDSQASLTIEYATDLTVYGAHQMGSPDADGNITANGVTANYSDVLRANKDITTTDADGNTVTIYDDPWSYQYAAPSTASVNTKSGGAGIGGGATYGITTSASSTYTSGTPGTIVINGGNIEAYGGHQAAGIGGGYNGAASSVTINNGNVIAHGGRWAAGIGDGDSAPDATAAVFTDQTSPKYITINGGTVTAYGGVASAGIGCTDSLGSSNPSCLEIAVNGGTVNAFSGFPDGFSGSGSYTSDQNAPAAIGAGSKSVMESNSIYISSAANLTCAAFGNYSLTEIGNNANATPTINVDSDGYLLLLRTAEYYSSTERKLVLYRPQTRTIVTNADAGEETECIVYVEQATGVKYYLDDNNALVYIENADGTFTQLAEDDVPENLTLYVDENSEKLDEIELAYFFRSIALTLPKPEDYGGLYALAVPIQGISSGVDLPDDDYIVLSIEAHSQGTQSGTIDYPSPNNLAKDTTAEQLVDLDAFEGTLTLDNITGDGLIGDEFLPGVYAYTVYVDSDCDEATLYVLFNDDGTTTYDLLRDNAALNSDDELVDHGDYREASIKVDLSGVSQKTIRLKKRDNSDNLNAVVYRVTFIKKGSYKLNLTDPSKVYDGNPVSVSATGVYSGTMYTIQNVASDGSKTGTATLSLTSLTNSANTFYLTSYNNKGSRTYYLIDIGMELSVQTTDQPNVLYYILSFTAEQGNGGSVSIVDTDGYRMGWEVVYDEETGAISSASRISSDPDSSSATWISSDSQAIATVSITQQSGGGQGNNSSSTTTYTAYLYSTADGLVQVYRSSDTSQKYTLFELGEATLSSSGSDTKASAEQNAQDALNAGATSGIFEYVTEVTKIWTQAFTVGTVTASQSSSGMGGGGYSNSGTTSSQSLTNTYSSTGGGYYEIVAGGDDYTVITATQDELDSAEFTYYQIAEDGVTETLLSGPPSDAGNYRVTATVDAKTFAATGSQLFTISTRPITVLQIENWLIYLTGAQVAELEAAGEQTLAISDPGTITLYNVISGDNVVLSSWSTVYYNSIGVAYSSDKISIFDPVLTGIDAHNYHVVYTRGFEANNEVRVFGQIAYSTNGTIFRKTEDGLWLKFYPVDASDPMSEDSDDLDYHSPAESDTQYGVYLSHAEYVKARTINESGSARYAVDLEYGAMQFTYYYGTWDVNALAYDETDGSYWSGLDGSNNKLTVTNYSNEAIQFQLSTYIFPQYSDYIGDGSGITASIAANADGSDAVDSSVWTTIERATAGDSTKYGSSVSEERWLILTGVPQVAESTSYTTVGSITLTVAPAENNSS